MRATSGGNGVGQGRRCPWLVVVAAVGAIGCTGDVGSGAGFVRIDTIGGVLRSTTVGGGTWRDDEKWTVGPPSLRIGVAEGDANEIFGSIAALGVGRDCARVRIG